MREHSSDREHAGAGGAFDRLLPWFEQSDLEILDLTGGAPEMVPDFRYIIEQVRAFDKHRHIIDRRYLARSQKG